TYADEGSYTITVLIHHDSAAVATAISTATVADAALSAAGLDLTGTEGMSTGPITVATFTDLGGPESTSDYSATINWGGAGTGSSTGTVVANADGSFSVQGSFTYAE